MDAGTEAVVDASVGFSVGMAGKAVNVGNAITPPFGVGLEMGTPGMRVGGRKV